jgi:ribosomal protein S18 acetylase RimI-like enzyme
MSTEQPTMTRPGPDVHLRPFGAGDFAPLVALGTAVFPDAPWNEDELRHWEATWDYTRYHRQRVIAEDNSGRLVGYGMIRHVPWEFDPQKYFLLVMVHPEVRRRGIGSAVYDDLLAILAQRDARVVHADVAKETMTDSIAFLTHRGFAEVARGFESRLDVAAFDFARFAGAAERVAAQGIVLTTLAAERERDPDALRRAYELELACGRDVPGIGEPTDVPFELFLQHSVERPTALPDAFFLAKDGDDYVGLSQLQRRLAQPAVLQQHLTGVRRGYRGRGIAMALKLQTVKYAQAHGYREIRTGNDARNRAMLRINEAMGYVKEPATITFEKPLP